MSKKWSCNTKLQVGKTYTLYLTHRICYADLLLAPAEDFGSFYEQTGDSPGNCNTGSGLKQFCLSTCIRAL